MKPCCAQLVDLLVDYLEGELPEEKRQQLEEHFEDCLPCLAFLKTYEGTGPVCRAAIQKAMPKDMADALVDFLRHEVGPET